MNREERKVASVNHTNLMESRYGNQIKESIEASKCYSGVFLCASKGGLDTQFSVVKMTTQEAIKDLCEKYPDDKNCALNFASYKNPGGGFINGSRAQEEYLCADSFLYNVLSSDKLMDEFYIPNRKDLNYGMYRDKSIYSPNILFFEKYMVDIITCPAPNLGAVRRNCALTEEAYLDVWKFRVEHILSVAEINGVDNLILGAWGCGVFQNKPNDVANVFKTVLNNARHKGMFKNIIFAIPDDTNYKPFSDVFMG